MQNFYSNEQLLDGLRFNDHKIITFIYHNYYPMLEATLLNIYKENTEDIKDVFQDSLLYIYEGVISDPPLTFENSFIALLTTICKRNMIKKLRYKMIHYKNEEEIPYGLKPEILELIEKTDRIKLFQKHFNEIGVLCQKLIKMTFAGISVEEITTKLNIISENFTRKKRTKCKESLFTKIFNDPQLKELINGKPWTIRKMPRW